VQTDSSGRLSFRGFYGDYSLKVKPGNGPEIGHRFAIDKKEDVNSFVIKTVLQ
jgi:hypothetical protein